MRKLIVRFRNQKDLDILASRIKEILGIELKVHEGNNIKEIKLNTDKNGIITSEIIRKKIINKKTERKKLDKYMEEWREMPEFLTEFHKDDYAKIDFFFDMYEKNDSENMSEIFGFDVKSTSKNIWFPKLTRGQNSNIRVIGGRKAKYPIYVVSKNRSQIGKIHVSSWLSNIQQPHYIIVEKDEVEKYQATFGQSEWCTILELPQIYKNNYDVFDENIGQKGTTGPGAARNYSMDHAKMNGFKWSWCLDDNVVAPGFVRYYRGRRISAHTGEAFRTLEDFVDRYENIGQAGLNYRMFCADGVVVPPYTLNTRIYSFLLLNNELDFRWRGRYNEDTDLSLRILKAGYCTVQWNLYTISKAGTQQVKGGNTEEFYAKEGTLAKSEMLAAMHPDVAKVVWKFGRWHHHVDYSGFTQELKLKPEFEYLKEQTTNNVEEHGVRIVRIPMEEIRTEKDTMQYILENYDNEEYLLPDDIFLD